MHDFGIIEGFDHTYKVSIIDPTENYVDLMSKLFDFE